MIKRKKLSEPILFLVIFFNISISFHHIMHAGTPVIQPVAKGSIPGIRTQQRCLPDPGAAARQNSDHDILFG